MPHQKNSRHSNTQTLLANLPDELLDEICSYLPCSTCYHVSLVSRRLNQIIEPHLYHATWGDSVDIKGLNILTQTVKTRPELGAHILRFYLSRENRDFHRQEELITALPNLHELELDPPANDLQVQFLFNLRILKIDFRLAFFYHGRHMVEPWEIIARHFWMPSLRELHVARPSRPSRGSDIRDGFWVNEPYTSVSSEGELPSMPSTHKRTSPITTFCLKSCDDEHPGNLPRFLLAVKELHRFTYGVHRAWCTEDIRFPGISPTLLKTLLEPHASTLMELVIYGEDASEFVQLLFGTLRHFNHLKRLAIPESFITSEDIDTIHEMLPFQLESLQLQYPMGTTRGLDVKRAKRFARVRNLVIYKPNCLSRLRQVIWWYQHA